MNKITNREELISWARQVNLMSMTNHSLVCNLQDVFAHSNPTLLKDLFFDLPANDKHLVIFSVQKCMGSETFLDFIDGYIKRKGQQWINNESEDINEEWQKIMGAKEALRKEKKEYEYKIDGLNRKNDLLARANNDYYRTITKLSKENITLRAKLEEMEAELKKQHAFESHIKELLKAA